MAGGWRIKKTNVRNTGEFWRFGKCHQTNNKMLGLWCTYFHVFLHCCCCYWCGYFCSRIFLRGVKKVFFFRLYGCVWIKLWYIHAKLRYPWKWNNTSFWLQNANDKTVSIGFGFFSLCLREMWNICSTGYQCTFYNICMYVCVNLDNSIMWRMQVSRAHNFWL